MSKMPLAITGFLALTATIVLLAVTKSSPLLTDKEGPGVVLTVEASFYPIAEFARQVGGDLVTVGTITPGGVEPHEYQPTSRAITEIYSADVFLYNGGGVDAWADAIALDVAPKGVVTAEMASLVETADPHTWLSPRLAMNQIDLIAKTFSNLDPMYANAYSANAAAYKQKLADLDADYRQSLSNCGTRVIVTSHDAFAYLAQDYNIETIAITGLSPEEEPSAGRLSEIAALAQEKQIKYIYFETLVSPKLAETIASEIGAQTLVFNPIEGLTEDDVAQGKDYLSIMRENLINLKTGMLCQ